MQRTILGWSTAGLLAVAGAALAPAFLSAEDNNGPVAVTVSFGAGLNTAQPGNAANHHVLPKMIHVQAGGVVNFNVAGFHQIFVYHPEQMTYLLQGALKFRVEGEEIIVREGEVLHIPANARHQAEALDDTFQLDIFSPPRGDWLRGEPEDA